MTFEQALEHVLRFEGGYVNHPDDPGGATNFGVTQATYDAWRRNRGLAPRPVKQIERSEVEAIYRERYWKEARCDDLPPELRLIHFDAAVNCGTENAIRFLQRALGVKVDGVFGPVTLGAARARDVRRLADDMLWERLRYYQAIAARKRPDGRDLRVFLPAWLSRLITVREIVRKAA